MTERERIENTYRRVKKKYPNVTDKAEIDKLAIKLDKRDLLLKAFMLLLGAVVCCVLITWLSKTRTDFSETNGVLVLTLLSALFEFVRTLIKYFKVENTYKPIIEVGIRQTVDVAEIMKDYGKKMKNLSEFSVNKITLYDKEDDLQVLVNNATSHDYYLYFKDPQTDEKYNLEVKQDAFSDAVIGTEYYVVLTKDKEDESNIAIGAYPTAQYTLADDVTSYCDFDVSATQANMDSGDVLYQPNVSFEQKESQPVKKVLPIIALILCAIGFFVFGLPLTAVALVLSIIAVARQRSKLSIASLVVSSAFLMLTILAFFVL